MVSLENQRKKETCWASSQHARKETGAKLLEHWDLVKQWPIYKSQFILGELLGSTPLDIDEGWLEERQARIRKR